MFTTQAAKIIGITPRQLRAFLRSTGTHAGSGARYEFSYEEVEELSKAYWAKQVVPITKHEDEDPGTPGLPIDWLRDKQHEAQFLAERQARVERMNTRLREVGLSVPQMSEKQLTINMRALTGALLGGTYSDEG